MAAKRTTKGMEGTRTGGTARKLIRNRANCLTLKQIGSRTNRSASTLGQILNGSIKNPPSALVSALRKIPGCK